MLPSTNTALLMQCERFWTIALTSPSELICNTIGLTFEICFYLFFSQLGWSIGPNHLIKHLQTVQQNTIYTCATPLQVGDVATWVEAWFIGEDITYIVCSNWLSSPCYVLLDQGLLMHLGF
jgi:hypothetical protein